MECRQRVQATSTREANGWPLMPLTRRLTCGRGGVDAEESISGFRVVSAAISGRLSSGEKISN